MKFNLFNLVVTLFLFSCASRESKNTEPEQIYPRPLAYQSNPDGDYPVNSNGSIIQPMVNSFGDTIKTGVPILVEGKIIHSDSISKPKPFSVKNEDKIKRVNAHPNVKIIPAELNVINLNKDSLKEVPLAELEENKSHFILNSTGDTISTGISISFKGKELEAIQPKPTAALPPRFKDNTTNNIQYLDVEQGMASSYVWSILEDKNGSLWFGTYGGGVSKYNGASFTHYTSEEGLSSNYIHSIFEDKQGDIWFGTQGGGVCKYNGQHFTHYTEKEGLSSNNVLTIIEDKAGNLWFGTNGGGAAKFNGTSFIYYTQNEGLSNNTVYSITEDKIGNIWFGTDEGLSKFDGVGFTNYTESCGLSNNVVLSTLEDKDGNIWIGTYGSGVSRFDGQVFTNYSTEDGLSNNTILSILEDRNGNLWLSTDGGGVNKYDGKSFIHFTEEEGLSSNYIWFILEDTSGNLWFGSDGGGVCKYDIESFIYFTEKEGLTNNYILSILEDKNENIWFGTNGGGVAKYNGNTFTSYTEQEGLSSDYIRSIVEDKNGNIWFATYGEGVNKFDGKSITHYTKEEGLISNMVRSIIEDKGGNIWFGTEKGLCKFDGENFTHYTEREGLSSNVILTIVEDRNENLWLGSQGGGVSKFDGENFTHYSEKEGLASNTVLSILEDKNGSLWFGTYGDGVSKFDGENFIHYTEKEGLSNNIVWSFIEDKEGSIWVSTEKGLNKFVFTAENKSELEDKEKVKNNPLEIIQFEKNDGLKGLDFYPNSAYLDSKNRMWWGSGKGLTMLNMNKFRLSSNPPRVHFNGITISEEFIDFRHISDDLKDKIFFDNVVEFNNYPNNLELAYDQNNLSFHYSAIDWNAPHKIRYSFRLLGQSNTWSKSSEESKAVFRDLTYGAYTFQLRAIGQNGEWSRPFIYSFEVLPPWWYTWWAYTAYGFCSILLIWGFVSWRLSNFKERQQELEAEVAIATTEIREQKEEIEESHREITDSIAYAKRIQSAILPSLKLVKEYLDNSFVLYKPKDVVAGDFYWLLPQNDLILFAAADCTGHGVPGALVSVVCHNGLNRSVREHGLRDPGQILDKTREIVIAEFEKSEEEVKDGMDIALCALKGKTLKYAGANNPLYIIRKGAQEVEEIKANKQPIGKSDHNLPYTTHTINLNSGDSIYLFSDGFVDQFGGALGKKLKAPSFRELLLSIQEQPMEKQQQFLDKTFEEWKGDLEQVDDVCIIGLRV